MKIVVLMKQTPDTETKIVLSPDKKKLDHSATKFMVNPYDEFAIEEALKIKGTDAAIEVVICTVGDEASKERILKGLAMGADRGVLVVAPGGEAAPFDSLTTAKLLAALIQSEKADLVLCGKQAIDDDNMHVGIMTAELLGWPHVNVVTKMECVGNMVSAFREIEGGQLEKYEVKLPAIFGAHKSLNTPRYASLPGIMKAKKKTIDTKTPADLGVNVDQPKTHVVSYAFPPEKPKGKMFKGEPVEVMVEKVVKLLREEAKVI